MGVGICVGVIQAYTNTHTWAYLCANSLASTSGTASRQQGQKTKSISSWRDSRRLRTMLDRNECILTREGFVFYVTTK